MLKLIIFALWLSRPSSALVQGGRCNSNGAFMDRAVLTAEIRPFKVMDMALIGFNSDYTVDRELKCAAISMVEGDNIILTYTGLDSDNNPKKYVGKAMFDASMNYLTVVKAERSDLPPEMSDVPDEALNVAWNPKNRLYIPFFSDTEIVMLTCEESSSLFGLFVSAKYTPYVYTSQPALYMDADKACMAENVKNLPGLGLFDVIFETAQEISACEAMPDED